MQQEIKFKRLKKAGNVSDANEWHDTEAINLIKFLIVKEKSCFI